MSRYAICVHEVVGRSGGRRRSPPARTDFAPVGATQAPAVTYPLDDFLARVPGKREIGRGGSLCDGQDGYRGGAALEVLGGRR